MAVVARVASRFRHELVEALREARALPTAETVRRSLVLVLGLMAGLFLVATEFSNISSTVVIGTQCGDLSGSELADGCATSGGERHGYVLLVLGVVAGAMAWGAARRNSRPAALVLAGTGLVALGLALLVDLPSLNETGTMGQLFSDVETRTGVGFWLELAGAGCALAAGWIGLIGRRMAPVSVAAAAAGT